MPRSTLIVLADDLTGAAEIAAIAHEAGLRALVCTAPPARRAGADVLVLNTDSRLLAPAAAARRVRSFLRRLRLPARTDVFKKIDSVLRGPVLAEAAAAALILGRRRTLLMPGNPSLGRVVRTGRYFIAGQSLDSTAFARDPHHPRFSADVLTLLGAGGRSEVVRRAPGEPIPRAGVVVAEATSVAEVSAWARRVDADTLPVGGADFFRAWLQTRRRTRAQPAPLFWPNGAVLLLSGTLAAAEPVSPFSVDAISVHAVRRPVGKSLPARLRQRLRTDGRAAVVTTGPAVRRTRAAAALTRSLARLARQLQTTGDFRHLVIAGGATAAAVLQVLGWAELRVARVWGPGVVTLRPIAAPGFVVTLKPGSYVWPERLRREFRSVTRNQLQ